MPAPILICLVIGLSSDMAENVPHMCEMKLVVRLTSVAYKSHFKPKRLCRIKSCLIFQADIIHDVQGSEEPHLATFLIKYGSSVNNHVFFFLIS